MRVVSVGAALALAAAMTSTGYDCGYYEGPTKRSSPPTKNPKREKQKAQRKARKIMRGKA